MFANILKIVVAFLLTFSRTVFKCTKTMPRMLNSLYVFYSKLLKPGVCDVTFKTFVFSAVVVWVFAHGHFSTYEAIESRICMSCYCDAVKF